MCDTPEQAPFEWDMIEPDPDIVYFMDDPDLARIELTKIRDEIRAEKTRRAAAAAAAAEAAARDERPAS